MSTAGLTHRIPLLVVAAEPPLDPVDPVDPDVKAQRVLGRVLVLAAFRAPAGLADLDLVKRTFVLKPAGEGLPIVRILLRIVPVAVGHNVLLSRAVGMRSDAGLAGRRLVGLRRGSLFRRSSPP